jgi:hypothetical protein
MSIRTAAALVLSMIALVASSSPAGAQSRCTAAKYNAMGRKYLAKTKCYAKTVQRNVAVDPGCLASAEARFLLKWARAEAHADCFTTNDDDANEAIVDACIDDTVQSLKTAASTTTSTAAPTTTTLCAPSCAGKNCGDDGCGGSCGMCTPPDTCAGGGTPGVCGCTPATCEIQCASCGSIGDGCGGTLNCGTCTLPETCGGSGAPNVCGTSGSVTTTSTSSSTVTTGTMCSLTCGVSSCPSPYACVGGTGPCHCEIPATACTSKSAPTCGGGACQPPLVCRDAGGSCACLPACTH